MTKQTTISLRVITDDQGNRTIDTMVTIKNGDQFVSEEAKEESTASDINYLFDQIDSGEISRSTFV